MSALWIHERMDDDWLQSRLRKALDESAKQPREVLAISGKGTKARRKLQAALDDLDAIALRHGIHDEIGSWEMLIGPSSRGLEQFLDVGYIQASQKGS